MSNDQNQSKASQFDGSAPELTIAIPAYNCERTLQRTIDGIFAQTFENFIVIIGDNCSSDHTREICAAAAASDPRIRLRPLDKTVPAELNFHRLLHEATTPYFMFAAADDYIRPEFAHKNLENLKSHPNAVCSVSEVEFFFDDGRPNVLCRGTFSVIGGRRKRLRAYLWAIHDNSRIYGIYRTQILQQSFYQKSIIAQDWLVVASTLMHGDHLQVPEVLLLRELTPVESYCAAVEETETSVLMRCFPALRMTMALSRRIGFLDTLALLPEFAALVMISTIVSPYPIMRRIRSLIRPKAFRRSVRKWAHLLSFGAVS
jgi:glycosyltransferase involved in cell wall biosynthesis